MRKKILLLIMAIALAFSGVMANSPPPPSQIVALGSAFNQLPGTVSLPLNMYGFTNVGSIDLKINFDRNLVQYVDYSGATVTGLTVNESLPGVLSVSFVNFGSVGVNITGLLANLNFIYLGSFTADLVFNQSECEVSDFTTIMPVPINSFTNGQVTALTPFDGIVSLVPQQGLINSSVSVPLTIQGTNFTNLSAITFKIAYNPAQLSYQGVTNNPMDFSIGVVDGLITIGASGNSGANLNALTTILNLNFVYLGGGTAQLNFQPGSQVVDFNFNVMSTLFLNATVQQDPISDLGTLTIASPSAVTSSSFNVPISVSGLSSSLTTVGAATIKVAYDTANLIYTGYAANQLAAGGWVFAQSAGHLTFVKTNATAMTIANGDLLTLAFKGKCAKTGTAALSFDPGTFLQETDFSNLPMTLVNGSVTLTPAVITSADPIPFCQGSSAVLVAPSGISYLWSPGGSTNATLTVSSAGTYSVSVLNEDLCTITASKVVTVNPILPVSVSIAAVPTGAICAGTSVTFTATPTNGGTPTYQWYANGTTPVGSNSATFTTTALVNGDAITVKLTSSETCQSGGPATSSPITMTVNPILPVSVSIAAVPSGAICAGTSVTFTATPTNGGTPTYQWYANGSTPIGTNSPTFTSSSLVNGDDIFVELTSSETCQSGGPAYSSPITMVVNQPVAAAGSISGSPTLVPGATTVPYSVPVIANATSYNWSYTGTNVTINGTGNSVTLDFGASATGGQLKVKGSNACGDGAESFIEISGTVTLKVFLEGPFASGAMNTTLRSSGLIPLTQPYGVAPWNHTTLPGETVASIPANVVDWVLVELRDAASAATALPATKLAGWPKAFFLKNDGSVVGTDGVSPINTNNFVLTNKLFIVIRHRDHIAIMSENGLTAQNNFNYDFSTALTQVYGGGVGYKLLATGIYGMVAADANADGQVLSNDRTIWLQENGSIGYKRADFNMDGQVLSNDRTKWLQNNGRSTPVTGASKPGYKSQVPTIK